MLLKLSVRSALNCRSGVVERVTAENNSPGPASEADSGLWGGDDVVMTFGIAVKVIV